MLLPSAEPFGVEPVWFRGGWWVREWWCAPPRSGVLFTVAESDWDGEVQRVWSVDLVDTEAA